MTAWPGFSSRFSFTIFHHWHALLWKIGFVSFIKLILYLAVEKHATFSFHVFCIGRRVLTASNAFVNPPLNKSTVGLLLIQLNSRVLAIVLILLKNVYQAARITCKPVLICLKAPYSHCGSFHFALIINSWGFWFWRYEFSASNY